MIKKLSPLRPNKPQRSWQKIYEEYDRYKLIVAL